MNYYLILQIERTATQAEVKKAYHRLASKYHPDKGGTETKFKELKKAYETLHDVKKRAEYDSELPKTAVFSRNIEPEKPEHEETREEELKRIFHDPDYQLHSYFQPKYKKSEGFERSKRAKEKKCPICHGRGFVRYNVRPELGFIGIEERLCSCQIVDKNN